MSGFDDYQVRPARPADVQAWIGGVPWSVPSVGLILLGLAGCVLGFLGEEGRCSPTDPTVCGADPVFAVFFALLLLTPVLLWFTPRLGCVVGAVAGVCDVIFDGARSSGLMFAAFTIACLVVLLGREADNARAKRSLEERAGAQRVSPPRGLVAPGWSLVAVLAGVLAVLAVAGVFLYAHLQEVERRHLASAQQVTATVSKVDEDGYAVQVRLPDGETRVVDTLDYYDRGDSVPVLVDPADRSWVRLVAEPYDATGWLIGVTVALGLAVTLAWRELSLRHWRRQSHDRVLHAVGVEVDLDPALTVANLYAVGAREPFATFSTLPTPWPGAAHEEQEGWDEGEDWEQWDEEAEEERYEAELGEVWRSEPEASPRPLETGVLVGDLAPGGLAMVLLREGVLWPNGALTVVRPAPLWWRLLRRGRRRWLGGRHDENLGDEEAYPRLDDEPDLPGRPVVASAGPVPALPFVRRPPAYDVRLSWLKAAAFGAVAVAVVVVSVDDLDLHLLIAGLFATVSGAHSQWLGATSRLVVDEDGLVMRSVLFTQRIPWSVLHGVRLDGRDIVVAWRPDHALGFGPVDDPETLAGTIEALRAQREGASGPAATRHLRLDSLVIPLLGVACAAAVLLHS